MHFDVSFCDRYNQACTVCFDSLLEATDFVRQCIMLAFNHVELSVIYANHFEED